MKTIAVLLLLIGIQQAAQAEVLKWVDENGRTHYGDVVPEKYRTPPKPVKLQDHTPSEADREAARRRSEADKASLAAQSAPVAPQASAPSGQGKSRAVSECEKAWQEYSASQACFQPYRMARGAARDGGTGNALNAEAYKKCKEVPEPQCQR